MPKTALFVAYGEGHAQMMCPVVLNLRKSAIVQSGNLNLIVLGLPAAKHIFNSNGIECLTYRELIALPEDADAIEWGKALLSSPGLRTRGIDHDEMVAYLGLNFKELVRGHGVAKAQRIFCESGLNAFMPVTVMERLFDRIAPDVVISSNSPRSEAAAIEVAYRRGVPSLVMTDLFSGKGGAKIKASSVTFLNDYAKDAFIRDGFVDERSSTLYCTGNPAFDKLLAAPQTKDDDWLLMHFIRAVGRKVVLHADTPVYWDTVENRLHARITDEIVEEMQVCYDAARDNDAVYLLRPHPSQSRDIYATWLASRPDAYLAGDCDLVQLLRNVDVVIVRSSTVGIEAAYLKKSILQIDSKMHCDLPLVELGLAKSIDRYEKLSEGIRDALTDDVTHEQANKDISKHLPNALAAPSVAGIILELTRK